MIDEEFYKEFCELESSRAKLLINEWRSISPVLDKWQSFLEAVIYSQDVNISDFIHRKIFLGGRITDNDISMVKFSGAIQHLALVGARVVGNSHLLVEINDIIFKIFKEGYYYNFLVDNASYFSRKIKEFNPQDYIPTVFVYGGCGKLYPRNFYLTSLKKYGDALWTFGVIDKIDPKRRYPIHIKWFSDICGTEYKEKIFDTNEWFRKEDFCSKNVYQRSLECQKYKLELDRTKRVI